jgi:hypothetical protein
MSNLHIVNVWTDDTAVYIKTDKGQVFCEKFAEYPRLRNATPERRKHFRQGTFGLRWEELDEDFSFNGFMSKQPLIPQF